MELFLLNLAYLLASVGFIIGLKMLGSPKTARKGNLIAAFGMTLAILATIFIYPLTAHIQVPMFVYGLIFTAIAIEPSLANIGLVALI